MYLSIYSLAQVQFCIYFCIISLMFFSLTRQYTPWGEARSVYAHVEFSFSTTKPGAY